MDNLLFGEQFPALLLTILECDDEEHTISLCPPSDRSDREQDLLVAVFHLHRDILLNKTFSSLDSHAEDGRQRIPDLSSHRRMDVQGSPSRVGFQYLPILPWE